MSLIVEATVKKVDLASRAVEVTTTEGRDLTLKLDEDSTIEVAEEETMGTIEGSLEDLQVGFIVEVELEEHADGMCSCSNLSCVS
ncbi:MAG: hypothetical protein ACE5HK_03010 [Candidatus Methylomirabilales bacterium]